jgi:hypothetical protein
MRNFPKLSSNSIPIISERLRKKARQSPSKYRISAIAFDCHGDFIAQAFNGLPQDGVEGKVGSGVHAEAKLMMKYGQLVKTIVISRIGHGGDWRPIEPCENCKALADKLGIKLISIDNFLQ